MSPTDVLAQLAAFGRLVEPTLDQKSYYELLNLPPNAGASQIRAAYYKLAAQLHPDRYATMSDVAAKQKLESIYARITEGYRVLTDPERRIQYDKALQEGKKRLQTVDRDRKGPKNPEDLIKSPDAKRFFRMALIQIDKKDWKSAVMNLNFARAYEPKSEVIAEKLAEAQRNALAK